MKQYKPLIISIFLITFLIFLVWHSYKTMENKLILVHQENQFKNLKIIASQINQYFEFIINQISPLYSYSDFYSSDTRLKEFLNIINKENSKEIKYICLLDSNFNSIFSIPESENFQIKNYINTDNLYKIKNTSNINISAPFNSPKNEILIEILFPILENEKLYKVISIFTPLSNIISEFIFSLSHSDSKYWIINEEGQIVYTSIATNDSYYGKHFRDIYIEHTENALLIEESIAMDKESFWFDIKNKKHPGEKTSFLIISSNIEFKNNQKWKIIQATNKNIFSGKYHTFRIPFIYLSLLIIFLGLAIGIYAYQTGINISKMINKAEFIENLEKKVEKKTKEIAQSELHLKSIIESLPDIFYIITPAGYITFISNSVNRILGYTQDEIIGKNLKNLIHPEDLLSSDDSLLKILEGKKEIDKNFKIRLKTSDGIYRTFNIITNIIKDSSGDIALINGVLRDITEQEILSQKIIQYSQSLEKIVSSKIKELEISEEKFRNVIENIEDIVFTYSLKEGIFTFISPRIFNVFGLEKETIENQSVI